MKKYIIVTGGTGYIGSHVVIKLHEQGFIPIIFDNFHNSYYDSLNNLEKIIGKTILFHKIDIVSDYFLLICRKYINYNIVGIIHFAAFKSVSESVKKPILYYKNNIDGLCNVLAVMKMLKIKNFIFSSSATVYSSENELPFTEDGIVGKDLACPYGKTKYFCEEILKDFQTSEPDLKIIALRYFNPVGAHSSNLIGDNPSNKPENLFPIIKEVLEFKKCSITIFGNDYNTPDGTAQRDYIHIEDLADGHLAALKYIETKKDGLLDFINLGTGKGVSVLEIINGFKEYCGKTILHNFGERRTGDLPVVYACTKKAKELLNWESKKTLKDCIVSYHDYIMKNY